MRQKPQPYRWITCERFAHNRPEIPRRLKAFWNKNHSLTLVTGQKTQHMSPLLLEFADTCKPTARGQFGVDGLSREASLPDSQAQPRLRHTSPCWRNPHPAEYSLLCPVVRCCIQPPCTGLGLSTHFPNGQPRKRPSSSTN